VVGCPYFLLERESQPKGQEPHGSVVFDVGNPACVGPGAIDASIALGVIETHDRVVKDVVGVHTEFRPVPLSDPEVLGERKVRREQVRSSEGVHTDVAKRPGGRSGENTPGCPVGQQFRNRREPSEESVGVSLHSKGE